MTALHRSSALTPSQPTRELAQNFVSVCQNQPYSIFQNSPIGIFRYARVVGVNVGQPDQRPLRDLPQGQRVRSPVLQYAHRSL